MLKRLKLLNRSNMFSTGLVHDQISQVLGGSPSLPVDMLDRKDYLFALSLGGSSIEDEAAIVAIINSMTGGHATTYLSALNELLIQNGGTGLYADLMEGLEALLAIIISNADPVVGENQVTFLSEGITFLTEPVTFS